LVATASLTVDRHIIEGTLGCPVCHAEFAVHGGALELGESSVLPVPEPDALSEGPMMRTGALLGLDERGGLYVLDSVSSHFAGGLQELSPNSRFIALASRPDVEGASGVIIGRGNGIPLAEGCLRGVVIDYDNPELMRSAVRALAPGGRLVAPANSSVPQGIAELARDDAQWVGEREAVPALSAIHRAPR
jgi:hypothetical protein